ncbi:MAG: GNAT family N-acetyltransferase [Actinomycetota bacterium]
MPVIALRPLTDSPDDIALGAELVREYVIATAWEQAEPGREPDVGTIRHYMPDWRNEDFAKRYFPDGAFIIATVDGELAGCVAVTPNASGACEMNRLWVREPYRTFGIGRRLAEASLEAAVARGYTRMVLDVLPIRTRAIALYRTLGFEDVSPHHDYTFPVVAMGNELRPTDQ